MQGVGGGRDRGDGRSGRRERQRGVERLPLVALVLRGIHRPGRHGAHHTVTGKRKVPRRMVVLVRGWMARSRIANASAADSRLHRHGRRPARLLPRPWCIHPTHKPIVRPRLRRTREQRGERRGRSGRERRGSRRCTRRRRKRTPARRQSQCPRSTRGRLRGVPADTLRLEHRRGRPGARPGSARQRRRAIARSQRRHRLQLRRRAARRRAGPPTIG